MKKQNNDVLLVIDPQVDFCDVPGAALPVAGAVKDMGLIAQFIKKHNPARIMNSMDSHYKLDIAHPTWWENADGSIVSSFTLITADDIKNGKYVARIDPVGSLKYVEALEANGEFNHFIWPEHCLIGTPGHNLHPVYFDAISQWMVDNLTWANFINKGTNPYTEHFGIFRANVPIAADSANTDVNQGVFNLMKSHDTIFLAGEARTHCVANSLRQMLQIAPDLAPKIVVLEDGMSDVGGLPADFYKMVDGIYDDAYTKGVRKAKIADL